MIPISKPLIDESEIKNVVDVLKSGMLASGEWVKKFEEEFVKYIGVKTALDIALKALDVKSGDEVIVPDFTFIATANAALFQNAKPVFADVDKRFSDLTIGVSTAEEDSSSFHRFFDGSTF